MATGTLLIYSMLFGSVGIGYFIYGKKQGKMVPLITGMVLNVFPYFMPNLYTLIITGIILMGVPWVYRP
ncbi:MAG TPA: hypothetical protein VN944_09240 [Nitrospiria bacterium]|nr:hypothetical protein [Nitrospiria bacterium]